VGGQTTRDVRPFMKKKKGFSVLRGRPNQLVGEAENISIVLPQDQRKPSRGEDQTRNKGEKMGGGGRRPRKMEDVFNYQNDGGARQEEENLKGGFQPTKKKDRQVSNPTHSALMKEPAKKDALPIFKERKEVKA